MFAMFFNPVLPIIGLNKQLHVADNNPNGRLSIICQYDVFQNEALGFPIQWKWWPRMGWLPKLYIVWVWCYVVGISFWIGSPPGLLASIMYVNGSVIIPWADSCHCCARWICPAQIGWDHTTACMLERDWEDEEINRKIKKLFCCTGSLASYWTAIKNIFQLCQISSSRVHNLK